MSVFVEKVRNRIHASAPYPIAGLDLVVPGANFSKTGGPHWSVPLSFQSCLLLRERFGDTLDIGPALWDWAAREKAQTVARAALSRADSAVLQRLPSVAPQLARAMESRPYQTVGVRFLSGGVPALLGDHPGLGKTLEAIGAVAEQGHPGPHLVVCPKTAVEPVWAREIPRWFPGQTVITVPDGRARRDALLDGFRNWMDTNPAGAFSDTWVVVHQEMMRTKSYWDCPQCGSATAAHAGKRLLVCKHNPKHAKNRDEHEFPQLFAHPWGSILADECDRMLIRLTGKSTQARRGMELLRVRDDGLKAAMSGTPFRSRPHLLWGILNWLDSVGHPGFWSWCETYFQVTQDGYRGARVIGAIRPEREEQLWRSLDKILLRRTKAEVAKDLPPKAYMGTPLNADPNSPVAVWLPMTPAQKRAYGQMLKTSIASIEGGDLSALGILAEMTRLKQFATSAGRVEEVTQRFRCTHPEECSRGPGKHWHEETRIKFFPTAPSNKLDYLEEWLLQMGFPDAPQGKVVIASQFTATLDLFAAELMVRKVLSKRADRVMLTGEVTGMQRSAGIDAFNQEVGTDSPHLMFLNIKAGGVAITLDTADDMFTIDETFNPDPMEQVEDRLHRVSRPRQVRYHNLRSEGSIEEAIALVNAERGRVTQRLLDGRRGVEYGRQVMEVARKL